MPGARQVNVKDGEVETNGRARSGNQLRDLIIGEVVQRDLAFEDVAAHFLVADGHGFVVVEHQLVTVFTLRLPAEIVSDHVAVNIVEEVIFVRGLHDAPVGRFVRCTVRVGVGVGAEEEDDGIQFIQRETSR